MPFVWPRKAIHGEEPSRADWTRRARRYGPDRAFFLRWSLTVSLALEQPQAAAKTSNIHDVLNAPEDPSKKKSDIHNVLN